MSKRHPPALAAVLAAILVTITGVTNAFAATTWTVRPGGLISLTSGLFTVTDTPTGTMIVCASSSLSGTLKSGNGHPGTRIGSLTAGRIRYCGNLGMFTLTAGDLPWRLNFTSYNATTRTVTGSISHLHIGVFEPGCRAVVDGTSGTAADGIVRFTYTNSTANSRYSPPAATCTSTTSRAVAGCSAAATQPPWAPPLL